MAEHRHSALVTVALMVVLSTGDRGFCSCSPTDGFSPVPLTESSFKNRWPYDLALRDRYRQYQNGERRFWVYTNDLPYREDSQTRPRSEIRIRNHDHRTGVWQFQGDLFVPEGTTGATVMRIHPSAEDTASNAVNLYVVHGELKFKSGQLVETGIYDRWVRINVVHRARANKIEVFVDGVKKLEVSGNGPRRYYFAFGVAARAAIASSNYMEARWKDVSILKKDA